MDVDGKADEDDEDEDGGFVDAETAALDVVRLSVGRCVDARIEGFLSLVGGAGAPFDSCWTVVVDDPDPEDDDEPASDSSALSLSFSLSFHSFSFLSVGLGGGLSKSDSVLAVLNLLSSLRPPSTLIGSEPEFESKIFVNPRPTLGLCLKKFASSVGVGVATVSPVAVRMTPFIAERRVSV